MVVDKLKVGDKAPNFCLLNQDDQTVCLQDYAGQWLVLYFYPRDNTAGCTLEAQDFTAAKPEFTALSSAVIGISPDSVKKHQNFIKKKELKVTLLSDPEHEVIATYGAWQLKKSYGKTYYGVVRSTFLINPKGTIAYIWPKVRVKGHVEKVKQVLSELKK